MAKKTYLSLERLTEYHSLLMQKITSLLSTKADTAHKHDDEYDAKGAADSALLSAQSYADNAANTVKNDLLNGAGGAYDTLKELGDLIDENQDAIEALETIATGKADAVHTHTIESVTGLEDALSSIADDITTAKNEAIAEAGISASNKDAVVLAETQKYVNDEIDKVEITIATLQGVVDGKANTSHSHAISEVTELESTLGVHMNKIEALEAKVGDGFEEISSEELAQLFAEE